MRICRFESPAPVLSLLGGRLSEWKTFAKSHFDLILFKSGSHTPSCFCVPSLGLPNDPSATYINLYLSIRSTLRHDFKVQKVIRVKVNDETWNTHKWFDKPRLSRDRTQRHSATGPLRQLGPARSSNSAYALFVWKPQTRWRRDGNSERAVPAGRKRCPVQATALGLGAGAELWIASDRRFRRCANYIQYFFGGRRC